MVWTTIGSIGALVVVGHLMLGPKVVPVGVMLPGLALLLLAGARIAIGNRRTNPRSAWARLAVERQDRARHPRCDRY